MFLIEEHIWNIIQKGLSKCFLPEEYVLKKKISFPNNLNFFYLANKIKNQR